MAGTASKKKPQLPDELVSRWPHPEQLPRSWDWGSMTCEERERWLIDGAYEQTDDGWVARSDRVADETAQQVIQAVTTMAGVDMIASDVLGGDVKPLLDAANADSSRDGLTDRPEGDVKLGLHLMAWYTVVTVLLFVIVVAALLTDMFGTRGGSDADSPDSLEVVADQDADDPAVEVGDSPVAVVGADSPDAVTPDQVAADEPAAPPTQAELAAQDPIPLTEGTWRFFAHTDEARALYDFRFEPDGTVYESGAEDHTFGAYFDDGTSVVMTITRTGEGRAFTPGKGERVEPISWTEWFEMTRVGNTMTGTWTAEAWKFTFEDGFVLSGEEVDLNVPGQVVFTRPQRPDDPG